MKQIEGFEMLFKKLVIKSLLLGLLCGAMPLFAMQTVKGIMRQIKSKPEYTKNIFDAIEKGRIESVNYWLNQNVDIEVLNKRGQTPLMLAIELNVVAIIQSLLDAKANIEATDALGRTLLMNATMRKNCDVVQLLLDAGAKFNDHLVGEIINLAITNNNCNLLQTLINRSDYKFDLNYMNRDGKTPLIIAADHGKADIVEFLLDKGVKIESVGKNGSTALMAATLELGMALLSKKVDAVEYSGRSKVIRLLLARGANIHDLYGKSIFDLAIEQNDSELWCALIKRGYSFDANQLRRGGQTLLLWAIRNAQLDVVRILIDKKANIEAIDENGQTVLMFAVNKGNVSIISLLLDSGVNIESADQFGDTVLMKAASAGNFDVVKLLLDYHANINVVNEFGHTALMYAIKNKKIDVIELLIDKGANPYLESKVGLNAFDHAENDSKMFALLQQTKFQAPVKKEEDAQKAIRRLYHAIKEMQIERQETTQQKEPKENVTNALAQAPLTCTEAHYRAFGAEIERVYGTPGESLLNDPIVQRCLVAERIANQQGKYVFYRSEPGHYRVYEYFLEELYRLIRLFHKINPIVFTRFFGHAAKEQTINQYIDTMQARAHKRGAEHNVLLSANVGLFGNINNPGSCTWDYFLKNVEATGKVKLQQMFESVFDIYGFNKQYIDQLLRSQDKFTDPAFSAAMIYTASLQQIIVPKKIVDDVVMFATDGYCFPWQTMIPEVPEGWNSNGISVDHASVPTKGRYTKISPILDKYKAGKLNINDRWQVRILMNALYGLNPESGIEFKVYTRFSEKRLSRFKEQVKAITDQMFDEWLRDVIASKAIPESVAGEPLGQALLAHFWQEYAEQEKQEQQQEQGEMKAKL